MKLNPQQLTTALDAVSQSVLRANRLIEYFGHDDTSEDEAAWYVQLVFTQLAAICEAIEMPLLRQDLMTAWEEAKSGGLTKVYDHEEAGPTLRALFPASRVREAIKSVFLTEPDKTITKSLEAILRQMTYAITDRTAFGHPPSNEDDVHRRIEAVLRCGFPDLLHKPALSKPIKNFIPDTG